MNSMFLFQIQGINHNSMLSGVLWWACMCCWLIAILDLLAKRDFAFLIYAGLAGYYQTFAFLVTPIIGVTLSYSHPNELNTATGAMFLTWSIWFTFITYLIALRREYTVYLALIFASVAIATSFVGASHLVAATSKQVLAFRLQKAGATFLLAGSLVGWSLLFQAMKPNTLQKVQSGHAEGRPSAVAREHYRTVMQSDHKACKLISLEQAQKERLRMFC
ncbi:hypothetical protein V496_03309 [Pseudogymnoascus sp. VKM F-4515 (FW-2607)]|nr:hypothetical protein V496_03309 [Pseudogymnoascus sp. VKM F-4515 (FW-2607)]